MKEYTYTVRIFDGFETSIYTTKATDALRAETKIANYHTALGGIIKKITVTQRRG